MCIRDSKYTANNIYIITEFCNGGDLGRVLNKKKKLTEQEVMGYLFEIVEAFREMKKHNVIHRDLKPANILLHDGHVKIADLGFAKTVSNFQSQMNTSVVGSPAYMAPQVLTRQFYSSKCDVWSLGIILYQLLFGTIPWKALTMELLPAEILNKPLVFGYDPVSENMRDFIRGCLQINEKDRYSWDEVFRHPLLTFYQQVKAVSYTHLTLPTIYSV
eukprot:TRINITY_DN16139_c0_g1_i1.p1 TRINITY_DN16139_c0_g1~~TRINITY_DN16139_c0_g1_i1.p1  ORF type:complete len:230 (-),score=53.63 TRINITY_DN16139_c0_g1_i1:34-681(-)